ncbi:MAG TPA: hypothetical protein VI306_23530 [Pyrinomonadaceae bacterium]
MKVVERNFLDEEVIWRNGPDAEHPYESNKEGTDLLIRLNDFPAESLYTLLVNNHEVADFDNWPENWNREKTESNNRDQSDQVLFKARKRFTEARTIHKKSAVKSRRQ